MLYHVSETPAIVRFEPRMSAGLVEPVVWAIDAPRLRNYLLPRDCPRVTYYAGRETSHEDIDRFLGAHTAVVAVERRWLERLRACQLFCYHLPEETFACIDECAGYFVSTVAVTPTLVDTLNDPIAELMKRDVDLRVVDNLWPLCDAVVASSLRFSMIRMRNASGLVDASRQ